jgi:hypothetical protein
VPAVAAIDYPVDLTVDYPEQSSRLWAALMIVLVRFIILIPHFIALLFLGIAQFFLFVAAQVVVVFTGVYPARLRRYVGGVLRWGTRVFSYAVALTDIYPPFGFDEEDGENYPVRVRIDTPPKSSRAFAVCTLAFMVLVVAGIELALHHGSLSSTGTTGAGGSRFNWDTRLINLRFILLFPHGVVLWFLYLAVFVLVLLVPWAILFSGHVPRGMFDFIVGVQRWTLRVSCFGYGLIEKYPPFSLDPSAGGQGGAPAEPPGGAPSYETTGVLAAGEAGAPDESETTGHSAEPLEPGPMAPAGEGEEAGLAEGEGPGPMEHHDPGEIEYEVADESTLGDYWLADYGEHEPHEEDETDT